MFKNKDSVKDGSQKVAHINQGEKLNFLITKKIVIQTEIRITAVFVDIVVRDILTNFNFLANGVVVCGVGPAVDNWGNKPNDMGEKIIEIGEF